MSTSGNGYSMHILLGIYVYLFMDIFTASLPIQGAFIALGVVLIAGLTKEYFWDKLLGKGFFDFYDVLYTFWGGFISLMVIEGFAKDLFDIIFFWMY